MINKISPFSRVAKRQKIFKKSPLSVAKKQLDFQVTSCHYFDTTNVDFAYIES